MYKLAMVYECRDCEPKTLIDVDSNGGIGPKAPQLPCGLCGEPAEYSSYALYWDDDEDLEATIKEVGFP